MEFFLFSAKCQTDLLRLTPLNLWLIYLFVFFILASNFVVVKLPKSYAFFNLFVKFLNWDKSESYTELLMENFMHVIGVTYLCPLSFKRQLTRLKVNYLILSGIFD